MALVRNVHKMMAVQESRIVSRPVSAHATTSMFTSWAPSKSSTGQKESLTDARIRQAAANLLHKYKSDKVFDKKDSMRFVTECMKQAGGKA